MNLHLSHYLVFSLFTQLFTSTFPPFYKPFFALLVSLISHLIRSPGHIPLFFFSAIYVSLPLSPHSFWSIFHLVVLFISLRLPSLFPFVSHHSFFPPSLSYFDEFRLCSLALHVRVCEPKGDGISSVEHLLDSLVLRVR